MGMDRPQLSVLPILFVCLFFGPLSVSSQKSVWQDYVDEARRAYIAKDYSRSEDLYLLAIKEADRFGVGNLKVAETLDFLSIVFNAQSANSSRSTKMARTTRP